MYSPRLRENIVKDDWPHLCRQVSVVFALKYVFIFILSTTSLLWYPSLCSCRCNLLCKILITSCIDIHSHLKNRWSSVFLYILTNAQTSLSLNVHFPPIPLTLFTYIYGFLYHRSKCQSLFLLKKNSWTVTEAPVIHVPIMNPPSKSLKLQSWSKIKITLALLSISIYTTEDCRKLIA